MRDIDELFHTLAKSRFRSKFHLQGKELDYIYDKGLLLVLEHARDFIAKRLVPALLANDGKQTPFRGHPVFIAQHATACCCRGCLQKWHRIPQERELSTEEQQYILDVLRRWLAAETKSGAN